MEEENKILTEEKTDENTETKNIIEDNNYKKIQVSRL